MLERKKMSVKRKVRIQPTCLICHEFHKARYPDLAPKCPGKEIYGDIENGPEPEDIPDLSCFTE